MEDFEIEGNLGLIGLAVTGILHCNVINHALTVTYRSPSVRNPDDY